MTGMSHRCSLALKLSCNGIFKVGLRRITLSSLIAKKKVITGKPYRTEEELAQRFIDHRLVKVFGGKGGDGRSSFLREKGRPFGGPDGGNGGNGGDVIFAASSNVKSLEKLLSVYEAENGVDGGGTNCYGRNGKNLLVKVPVGTYFRSETGEVVYDLEEENDQFVAAHGGLGGKGNRFFVSNSDTAPEECTPGEVGEARMLVVELRTLAHAGLIGFPNAGKSTLLRALTRSRPLVGEYQFTTLRPHVGILHFEDFTQIAIADIPGIIEGAHRNQGLGLTFLRHIERCRVLIYLMDLSQPDAFQQLLILRTEVSQYEHVLAERPSIFVANKVDLPEARENFKAFREKFAAEFGPEKKLMALSGKKGTNLEELIHTVRKLYNEDLDNERHCRRSHFS